MFVLLDPFYFSGSFVYIVYSVYSYCSFSSVVNKYIYCLFIIIIIKFLFFFFPPHRLDSYRPETFGIVRQ